MWTDQVVNRWTAWGVGGELRASADPSTVGPSCPHFCPQMWGGLYPTPEGRSSTEKRVAHRFRGVHRRRKSIRIALERGCRAAAARARIGEAGPVSVVDRRVFRPRRARVGRPTRRGPAVRRAMLMRSVDTASPAARPVNFGESARVRTPARTDRFRGPTPTSGPVPAVPGGPCGGDPPSGSGGCGRQPVDGWTAGRLDGWAAPRHRARERDNPRTAGVDPVGVG